MAKQESLLQKARTAKEEVVEKFGKLKNVSGVGITKRNGKYAVKINLSKALTKRTKVPKDVNGVEVILKIIGEVKKQRAASGSKLKASNSKAVTRKKAAKKVAKAASKKAASKKAVASKARAVKQTKSKRSVASKSTLRKSSRKKVAAQKTVDSD